GEDLLEVRDNGPGIPPEVVARSLDYSTRVSSNVHYVSPTRGQLGNALKCVWAAPFVADGEHGHVEVEALGVLHHVNVSLDRLAQQPHIEHTQEKSVVKNGSVVRLHWPEIASSLTGDGFFDFYNAEPLLAGFACFNPHAQFVLTRPDEDLFETEV